MGVSTPAKRGVSRPASGQYSHLQHEVIGVLLVALSLLALLSLVSFSPRDATLFSPRTLQHPPPTHNMIGAAGATLAGAFFRSIGGGAYLLPVFLALVGIRSFRDGSFVMTLRSAAGSLVSLVFFSGLLHLEATGVPTWSSGLVFRGQAGGKIGELLAGGLRSYFASTGAHIILTAGLLICLLLAANVSLVGVLRRVPVWWESAVQSLASLTESVSRLFERNEQPKEKIRKTKSLKITRSTPAEAREKDSLIAEPASERTPSEIVPPSEAQAAEEEEPLFFEQKITSGYRLPDPTELLSDSQGPAGRMTDTDLKAQSAVLIRALQSFGIEGKVTEVHPGPVVTMYEFEPAPGVKVARIVNLDNDLALALKAISLRIVAPIPGKSVVGIEVPNPYRETVLLKEVLTSEAFAKSRSKLTLALGKDIFGKPVTADLKTMPHLLVAGATGAGKSVSLNTMLVSILMAARPDEVKLLLIDPKMLEFQLYDGVPHLLRPVITNPRSAARGLGWVVQEMERRYKLLAEAGVRNIEAYNRWVGKEQGVAQEIAPQEQLEQPELPIEFLSEEARLSGGEDTNSEPEAAAPSQPPKTPPAPLPYIVVMIDELADLMMVAPKDVEDKIARLAQMARASGIHLVLATQRPSVDVLTGLIKANFPARIAFQVSSKTDSRTILDANGAEALLGRGDMLYLASGTGRLRRLHGSFVSDDDVRAVVEFVKRQAAPSYGDDGQFHRQEEAREEEERDEVYEQAKDLVLTSGQASASLIQRRLRVGYPRAARMIERMEQEGMVGAPGRDGRREVIVRRGAVGTAEE